MKLDPRAVVLDPWNGSGTTTSAAVSLGQPALGQDLNPVMVLVAKAGLLPDSEISSLLPLAKSILREIREVCKSPNAEPLETWLAPQSAVLIREIEVSINRVLVSHQEYTRLNNAVVLNAVSSIAAFFYVALFTTTRRLLGSFVPSNPTWVKGPASVRNRLRPSKRTIHELFMAEVLSLEGRLTRTGRQPGERRVSITLGNSESLQLSSESINVVVTSPPYCTRIDYAVATSIELAVLGLSAMEFDSIRRSLMGASTVSQRAPSANEKWGPTCNDFLERLYQHPSKASKTYYFKNHLQYFGSLKRSLGELGRVLCHGGQCVLVVQDSHYKELRNDVASIAVEMASNDGLLLRRRVDFASGRSMVGINKRAKDYLEKRITTESVLCLVKS